jgi:hypothetical protein
MTRATGGRGRAGLPQPYYGVLTARIWPRISPPGKSPGPVSGGGTPSSVWTLTQVLSAFISCIRAPAGVPREDLRAACW